MSSTVDSDAAERGAGMSTPATVDSLRVIVGPTAAGKSRIAMALAAARGLGIVSADSRQVYRGFDIGTAKATAAERALVPHRGIDVLSPGERYSAAAWARDADGWCRELADAGHPPVIVGGTGFYIRALVTPLHSVPALDPDRRARLAEWLSTLDSGELARWCDRLDPQRKALGRTQHLRAVETALLSGLRLGDALLSVSAAARPVRYLVIDPGPALAGRIESRVQEMLDVGWMDEVRRLVGDVETDAPAWKASGYETLRQCVLGRLPEREAVQRVVIETRQYAKRQRTWFRHQLHGGGVTRLDPDQDDAMERALAWWDGNGGETA